MILCGGSATDLPVQTPEYAKMFNVVDSFDTHAKEFLNILRMLTHLQRKADMSELFPLAGTRNVSLNRMYANAILPEGRDYTFWGKGVSQGAFRCNPPS